MILSPSCCHLLTLFIGAILQLFVANQNKPNDVVNILCANRKKLLRFFDGFNLDKGRELSVSHDMDIYIYMGYDFDNSLVCYAEDKTFEADKAEVIKEITGLVPTTPLNGSGELFKPIVV